MSAATPETDVAGETRVKQGRSPLEMSFIRCPRRIFALFVLLFSAFLQQSFAQDKSPAEYRLAPGDVIRVTVFQNADLQIETRVADDGTINYPSLGAVPVGGLSIAAAEVKLAQLLKGSGVEIEPKQLSISLVKGHGDNAPVVPTVTKPDYRLGPGDMVRIAVFQNPDMSVEARVLETGTITYPLLGKVELAGLTVGRAEEKLARLLKAGGFVIDPQVTVTVSQFHGNQISILGLVNKPGRYPLELANMKVTDVLALAGGIATAAGADNVVLAGMRDGKMTRKTIDLATLITEGKPEDDVQVFDGDILYVNKAPMFYIYGEVQRPGQYRVERNMTLMQALAVGGGITLRGTKRGIRVHRRNEQTGKIEELEPELEDAIRADDVISVRESWF